MMMFINTDPATLSSIYPNSRIDSPSVYTYSVPSGFTGSLLTCTGYGSPEAIINWIRNGLILDTQRITSNSGSNGQPYFVSASLVLSEGFASSDVGDYSCAIQTGEGGPTQSRKITLARVSKAVTAHDFGDCDGDGTLRFMIRFLDSDCLSWNVNLKKIISKNFRTGLESAISAECEGCSITDEITVTGGPRCSTRLQNAAVFVGTITGEHNAIVYCALSRWHQQAPIFSLTNGSFYRVDTSCSIDGKTCGEIDFELGAVASSPLNSVPATAAGILVVVLLVFVIGVIFLIYLWKKVKRCVLVYIA